jgi:hypothetical protein
VVDVLAPATPAAPVTMNAAAIAGAVAHASKRLDRFSLVVIASPSPFLDSTDRRIIKRQG